MSALSIFAISNDNIIIPLLANGTSEKFINNDNYKYKKIMITPLVLIALTYNGDIKLYGNLVDEIVDYTKYFDIDDIGYIEEDEEIVVIKNDKVYSLLSGSDYSNEVPEVMVDGELNSYYLYVNIIKRSD